jgi:glycosyltransferase involved in cell wall biosynthesis
MDQNPTKAKNRAILILTTDLYGRIGGGEHVYRTLIRENPKIDFYFFTTGQAKLEELPKNAHTIPLKQKPVINLILQRNRYEMAFSQKTKRIFNQNQINAAELAEQYAQSAKGYTFDLIDVPEYEIVGSFLRESLERNQVNFKILATFIHGSLSQTLDSERKFPKSAIEEIRELEKNQRDDSDIFFTLDSWYPSQLGIPAAKAIKVDPWQFIQLHEDIKIFEQSNSHPRLVFFGRWEYRKGIDLLPPLAKLIKVAELGIALFGDSSKDVGLRNQVIKSAKFRDLPIELEDKTSSKVVYTNMRTTDILIIPSRFDSFNLVALEGIANGKRVAITKQSGAYHFLKKMHPEIRFVELDHNNLGTSAQNLTKSFINWKKTELEIRQNRKSVHKIFSRLKRDQYTEIVSGIFKKHKESKIGSVHGIVFKRFGLKRYVRNQARKVVFWIWQGRDINLTTRISNLKLKWYEKSGVFPLTLLFLRSHKKSRFILEKLDKQKRNVYSKPRYFLFLSEDKNFSLIRRLTYAVRSLRFEGYKNYVLNSRNIISDISSIGLSEEAKSLEAILQDTNGNAVLKYLEARRVRLKLSPTFSFKSSLILKSKGFKSNPKISIVVSSYNAASKMEVFLKRLSLCPELLNGAAEILVIDANSDTPDSKKAIEIANKLGIALRAIRVSKRITIQEAWNFGITKAQGQYLSFLGVDETIYPTALTDLSARLDSDDSIDWVMADSIVTEVGSNGQYIQDVMKYARQGADLASPFLETCYVSYVAGMYRKDIHKRFGYYDSSFRGAGDTEFKSRVLPSLKVSYLDTTLGEFLNYPEERTTATERIELEDIRAWYIFRTPGGLRYQVSLAGEEILEKMGRSALGYRKSYCGHLSTDLKMASAIYELTRSGDYRVSASLLRELENASKQLKSLQTLLGFGPKKTNSISFRRLILLIRWFDIEGRKSSFKGARRVRMDNMFEQHIWYW